MKTMTTAILPRMPRADTDQSQCSREDSEIGSIRFSPRMLRKCTDQFQFRFKGIEIDPCPIVQSVVKIWMGCRVVLKESFSQ